MATNNNFNRSCDCGCEFTTASSRRSDQEHVHELVGSVIIEDDGCGECHNHRFATVTGEAERTNGCRTHVHRVEFTTDSYEDHSHDFCGYTGEAIEVGCGRHVHYINETTEAENQHRHEFRAATLIENPTSDEDHR